MRLTKGGHFAAPERPELFVAELRKSLLKRVDRRKERIT